jgi:hypothetical protein
MAGKVAGTGRPKLQLSDPGLHARRLQGQPIAAHAR